DKINTHGLVALLHHTNLDAAFSGHSDIALRPRGRPHKIPNTTLTTQKPNIIRSPPKSQSSYKTNDDVVPIGLSDITLRSRGRPGKIRNTSRTTQTPTMTTSAPKSHSSDKSNDATTPSLLATPQHSNVVASSSRVSNITPRSVGRPSKVQHIRRSTSGTHQEKGKSGHMKSLRRINFNDIDDEDENEI
nr:hypothetical protein [Tanacetum cinerariifolium]